MKKILTITFITIILCLLVSSISLASENINLVTETIIKSVNPDKIVQVLYLTYDYKDSMLLMKEVSKCLEKLDVFKVNIIYSKSSLLEPIRAEVWYQKD